MNISPIRHYVNNSFKGLLEVDKGTYINTDYVYSIINKPKTQSKPAHVEVNMVKSVEKLSDSKFLAINTFDIYSADIHTVIKSYRRAVRTKDTISSIYDK